MRKLFYRRGRGLTLNVNVEKIVNIVVTRVSIGDRRDTLANGDMNLNSTSQFKYEGTLVTIIKDLLRNILRAGNTCCQVTDLQLLIS